MNIRPYIILSAAALLASCNKNAAYMETETGTQPVIVFDYTPAPGQFINELPAFDGVTTAEAAREFAERRLGKKYFVSLGGFGGYIVVGFGKSIENSGGNDFSVTGNQLPTSSEPGVVWVMQDSNGNGKPDGDEVWYELSGSEAGKPGTVQAYEVTYTRPHEDGAGVEWADNRGGSGQILQIDIHKQSSYYPAWIGADSYTLRGTLLESRNKYDEDTKQWINGAYDWGYADNWGSDRGKGIKNQCTVYFKISNAVDAAGGSVHLESVDFIKVQTAVNASAGGLGELSTEVVGFAVENDQS